MKLLMIMKFTQRVTPVGLDIHDRATCKSCSGFSLKADLGEYLENVVLWVPLPNFKLCCNCTLQFGRSSVQQRDPEGKLFKCQSYFLSSFVQKCAYSVVQKDLVLLLVLYTCFVVKLPSVGCTSFIQLQFIVVGRLLVVICTA